jgi:RNA polymerase sigma-70 factor (ECF subfamily)
MDPAVSCHEGLTPAQRARHRGQALAEQLAGALARARAAWPGVELPAATYAAHLAAMLSRPENSERSLDDLHTDDLYLACACAAGNQAAIGACAARFGHEVRRGLGRLALAEDAIDEIEQRLRERLYVARPDRRPEIADYAGRGRLGAWMRVVAVRLALKSLRGSRREQPLEEEALQRLVTAPHNSDDPEQRHMKRLYGEQLNTALRHALEALSERDRALLRQHFIEGQTIDDLALTYDVHRATAARRVNRARDALIRQLRQTVRRQLQLDARGYQSIVELVRSQLDLSVERLLGDREPAPR